MINALLKGIMSLIIGLVSVILTPIDNLIASSLPSLSNALDSVSSFLNVALSSIGWVISLVGLNNNVISLIVLYYGFSLTAPMLFYFIKHYKTPFLNILLNNFIGK